MTVSAHKSQPNQYMIKFSDDTVILTVVYSQTQIISVAILTEWTDL